MYKTAPGWKIGTSQRDEDAKRAKKTGGWPGPDSYSPDTRLTHAKNAAWVIGSSQRNSMNSKTLTPAPNAYSPPSKGVEGSKFSMGLKLDNMSSIGTVTRRTMFNPGAGNYDPDYKVSKRKMPAFTMVARHEDS